MYCKHCGKPLEPGERKCSGCGRPVLLYKDGTGFCDLLDPAFCDPTAGKPDKTMHSAGLNPQQPEAGKKKRSAVSLLIASNFFMILLSLGLLFMLIFREPQEETVTPYAAETAMETTAAPTEAPERESTAAATEESRISEAEETQAKNPESKNETLPPLASVPTAPPGSGAVQEASAPALSPDPGEGAVG